MARSAGTSAGHRKQRHCPVRAGESGPLKVGAEVSLLAGCGRSAGAGQSRPKGPGRAGETSRDCGGPSCGEAGQGQGPDGIGISPASGTGKASPVRFPLPQRPAGSELVGGLLLQSWEGTDRAGPPRRSGQGVGLGGPSRQRGPGSRAAGAGDSGRSMELWGCRPSGPLPALFSSLSSSSAAYPQVAAKSLLVQRHQVAPIGPQRSSQLQTWTHFLPMVREA